MDNKLIQFEGTCEKWVVYKHPTNAIKRGTQLLIRPGQCAVICYDGQTAGCYEPGKYTLNEKNMPCAFDLSDKLPFQHNKTYTDIYFINTTVFVNNGWGTKDPIIRKDTELGLVRLTAYGRFSFKVTDSEAFLNAVFGGREFGMGTSGVMQYISGILSETSAITLGRVTYSMFDMAGYYADIGEQLRKDAAERMMDFGITLTEVNVEHIGTTDAVNEVIDDYAGMKLAFKDIEAYEKYQTIKNWSKNGVKPRNATVVTVGTVNGRELVKISDKD